MSKEIDLSNYSNFFEEAKGAIYTARFNFARSANQTNIGLYWDLEQLIVERQKIYGWEAINYCASVERLKKGVSGNTGEMAVKWLNSIPRALPEINLTIP